MEMLQKLTLYDLLGYALPGCVFLVFYNGEKLGDLSQMEIGGVSILIAFGFLVGIVISEFMRWVDSLIGRFWGKAQWRAMWNNYSLTCERMESALKKARILGENDSCADAADFSKYQAVIYADIQTDPKYTRIHNYASLVLLCKNMVLVTLFCMIHGMLKKSCGEALFGIAGLLCFGVRWQRISRKKMGYAICWFLEKYDGGETGEA